MFCSPTRRSLASYSKVSIKPELENIRGTEICEFHRFIIPTLYTFEADLYRNVISDEISFDHPEEAPVVIKYGETSPESSGVVNENSLFIEYGFQGKV